MQRGQTAFKPDKIALDEVVTDCVKLVYDSARKKMVGITVNIPVDTEDFADINMLQCLLRNLISNAIKIYATGWIYNPFGQTC
jgi:signal transduction histidine kinase